MQICQFPGAPSLESSRPPGPGQAWKFRKALGSPHFAKQRDETILSVREEGLRAPLVGQGSGSQRRLLRSRSDFIPVPRIVRARVRMGQIHNKQTHLPSCGLTVNVGNFSFLSSASPGTSSWTYASPCTQRGLVFLRSDSLMLPSLIIFFRRSSTTLTLFQHVATISRAPVPLEGQLLLNNHIPLVPGH